MCVGVQNPYAIRFLRFGKLLPMSANEANGHQVGYHMILYRPRVTDRYGAPHRPASVEAKKLPPMSEIILIISIRCYATAAANEANRSPGRGACNLHVTAIGRSPSWPTYVAGPRNQNARSSARARANNKIEWPIAA
jgi:hypothetical protein